MNGTMPVEREAPVALETVSVAAPAAPASDSDSSRSNSPWRRRLAAPVKLLWGMLWVQSLAGSVMVVGWSYRLAQRTALKYWWSRSARAARGERFDDFLEEQQRFHEHRHWPNWIFEQNFRHAVRRQSGDGIGVRLERVSRACLNSIFQNLRIGLAAIANTWLLTLPPALLWLFSWYDGWNNSFNKGYEQAAVGPVLGIIGVGLFIAVMFYLPLAQARQATTGQWKSFFQFRIVRTVARERWASGLVLAAAHTLLFIPVSILAVIPYYFPSMNPALAEMADDQKLAFLNRYWFWCALWVFPAYVFLRCAAAKTYARGMLEAVQTGQVAADELSGWEREALDRLGLIGVAARTERHRFVRLIAWFATRTGRFVSGVVLVGLWFSVVAQIYIAQFLNHRPILGWLNQPLIQLPWFHYVPASLKSPGGQIAGAALLLGIVVVLRALWRQIRREPR